MRYDVSGQLMKKKILILTTSLGGGHIAAGGAIAEAIEQVYPGRFEVKMLDALREAKLVVTLDKIFVPFYTASVKNLNGYPYRAFYRATDLTHDMMRKLLSTVFKTDAEAIIRREDPDLVISTFWFIGYAVSTVVKGQPWHKPVKVVSLITDSGDVHKMWLMSNEDAVLVSTPETIDYAEALGAPKNIMHYLGFPLKPEFAQLPTQAAARKKLGIDPRKFTVLITGGGLGLNRKAYTLARRLAGTYLGAQYLIVAGNDPASESRLKRLEFTDSAKVFGYVNNMPELIAAADIVVGKAGWVSLCEAFAARKPVMVIDMVPGQEEPNAELVNRHGIGWVLTDPNEAASKIGELSRKPQQLKTQRQNLAKLSFDPAAAPKIAKFIVERVINAEKTP